MPSRPYAPDVSSHHAETLRTKIPPNILNALDLYVIHGCVPGSCTRAVLSGDLFMAYATADPTTTEALPAIVRYVTMCLPGGCYGSPDAVRRWVEERRAVQAGA